LLGLADALAAEDARALLEGFAGDDAGREGLRIAAVAELGARHPDARTQSLLLPLSWKGVETPLRSAALRALAVWLDGDPQREPAVRSVVEAYRSALLSPSAILRHAAAEGAGLHPRHFGPEIRELLRREPDARIRRLLEAAD
jgi:hypothetical protein